MQRSRSTVRAPETSGEVSEPAGLGELPSLHEALERARAPDVSRSEVDTLLSVLALPPPSGEAARERAEVLHGIMEDAWVGTRVGSDGRRVAHAAVEALIELGYPHALQVPPELLAEAREARRHPGRKTRALWGPEDWARHRRGGAFLVGAAGLLECAGVALSLGLGWNWKEGGFDTWWAGLTGFLLLSAGVPVLTATTRPVQRSRWLRRLLGAWATLPGLAWLVPAPLVLLLSLFSSPEVFVYYLPVLGVGMMRILGAWRLYELPPSKP